ncbi:hypothetical protein [Dyadobacter sp. CY323]|uniref:hypothetical protein n=1 Tax=Dyadobacter sp. CY323 TaxID=2907302 RepID=UPI001F307274|nr:hypothetical protein [Dyadobacter sp. CY323]MCE6987992.1 hypothetical protein [Dyadobacter sp. CY323]
MKVWTVIVITILWAVSCNQVNDLNPVDPGTDPTEAVKVVKSRFPNAKDLVFKTIMSSKVWEVGFNLEADKYTSLVDQTKMWETFRSNADTVPALLQDLMPGSVFIGGVFSDNAEDIDFYPTSERRHRLIYKFNNTDYSFDWRRYQGTNYRPTNATFELIKYHIPISKMEDFPEEIRTYMAGKKELTLVGGEARVMLNYEKQYWMQVFVKRNNQDYVGFLIFDEKGNLRWMSQDFTDNATNLETLPKAIQRELDRSPELQGFKYMSPQYDRYKGEYDGKLSYYLKLTSPSYSQVCELYFDQEGNLLNKRYFVSF